MHVKPGEADRVVLGASDSGRPGSIGRRGTISRHRSPLEDVRELLGVMIWRDSRWAM